jgi:hypothetical protein
LLLAALVALAPSCFLPIGHWPLAMIGDWRLESNWKLEIGDWRWSGPRPGGLTLRLRDSWGNEVRGWSSLALSG